MRYGAGRGKTAGDRCPCDCHVRSGAESPQDSVRHFEAIHISVGRSLAAEKVGLCSVNINSILWDQGVECSNHSARAKKSRFLLILS